jgi:AcrR family transcriptional regulator
VTAELVDGRLARSARTRTAVIDALLALHEEGDLSPTAVRVASRAGVALRTVYGHFADMESLFAEAGQRELSRIIALTDAISRDLPLGERIDRLAATRARVLESMLATMRAAALREGLSPQLQENRDRFVAAGDAQVWQVLGAGPGRSAGPRAPRRRRSCLDVTADRPGPRRPGRRASPPSGPAPGAHGCLPALRVRRSLLREDQP